MRKRFMSVVGTMIGIAALAACTAAPAALSPGGPSVDMTPISNTDPKQPHGDPPPPAVIIDTMDPDGCSFVHNIDACFSDGQLPANIPMDEYTELYFMAADNLSKQIGIDPLKVKIKSIERMDWPNTALGAPNPGMNYAEVVTPGFRMVLEAGGKLYTYHTDTERVVFVEEGGEGDSVANNDKAALVKEALEWALVGKNIPDYNLLTEGKHEIVLSLKDIDESMVPDLPGVNLVALSPEEVQNKADAEGDFLHISFGEFEITSDSASVSIQNTWAVSKDSQTGHLSGGGCTLAFEKVNSQWQLGDNLGPCWIS